MAQFGTLSALIERIDLEPLGRALDRTLFRLGGAEINAGSLLKMVVFGALLWWAANQTRRWFVERDLHRLHMDAGTREAIGQMLRYLVLILGIALMLQNIGINLTALGVVAGALGVGVGFGLQNIISNFISGLIILFERPIKLGD